jgi:DNA-binding NtrC family response regulator
MLKSPSVLLFSTDKQEAARLCTLLSPYVELTCVQHAHDLERQLEGGHFDALFYHCSFDSTDWTKRLAVLRERRPNLPVIVVSGTEAIDEWPDVIEAGAFDFLVPPYGRPNLLAVVEQAVASTEARAWHHAEELEPAVRVS